MTWTSIPASAQIDAMHIAQLVEHVDDERFDQALLGILQEKGPAVEVNGFLYAARDRDPRPVSWCGRPDGTALRVDRYARGHATLVNVLMAERIGDAAYRRTCFESPAFSQKISVAHAGADGEWTILNIYLGERNVGQETVQRLAAFGSLVAPFLRRRGNGALVQPRHAADRVSRKLEGRFPTLTERERSVCALTMIGKSSGEIATALGIRPGTVITYRRRAYERLGVSSAAALVAEIL
jgi:DNA-binding CsgD family transcriptional regulator